VPPESVLSGLVGRGWSLLAATSGPTLLLQVLLQLVVIIAAARVMAVLFRRLGQPYVVGEIAAGLLLGPSCFGRLFPEVSARLFSPEVAPIFTVLSQIGLILLLFVIGLEFDFSHLRARGSAAAAISLTGIAMPFGLGLILAFIMHPHVLHLPNGDPIPRGGFMLFMGVAMSITAIPILGRMMIELNMTRTRLGTITITSAAIDDAMGWILLATISSAVRAGFQPSDTLRMLGETLLFLGAMIWIIGPALRRLIRYELGRNQGRLGPNLLAGVLVGLLLCAIATERIGIFAIFGAFLLGTVLSPVREFHKQFSSQLSAFLTAFFLPIFFTYTGLRTNIGTLQTSTQWWMLAGVLGAAIFGKLGGCATAARLTGFSSRESLIIGTMMNTRALMELVVINVGRDLGVISDDVFCMLVIMALVTTMITTPLMRRLYVGTELEPFIQRSGFWSTQRDMWREPKDLVEEAENQREPIAP